MLVALPQPFVQEGHGLLLHHLGDTPRQVLEEGDAIGPFGLGRSRFQRLKCAHRHQVAEDRDPEEVVAHGAIRKTVLDPFQCLAEPGGQPFDDRVCRRVRFGGPPLVVHHRLSGVAADRFQLVVESRRLA